MTRSVDGEVAAKTGLAAQVRGVALALTCTSCFRRACAPLGFHVRSLVRLLVLGFSASSLLLAACGGAKTPADLAAADADLGLGDVVMMTWTTREAAGLLGHALSAEGLSIDPHRRAMIGAERFVPTDQTLSIVVSRDYTASVGAKYGPVGGKAEGASTTHVAYEVRITGYLELGPTDLKYRPESACCAGGTLSGSCGDYYVMRLIRGSGKAEYLQKLKGSASASAMDVVHASGGAAFRKLSTSHFEDTYFAYELAPLDGVCALLTPEEEMAPMQVAAKDNCYFTAYRESGERVTEAWHLPDARLCWTVAELHSHGVESLLEFNVRFANAGSSRILSAADAVKPPEPDPAAQAPATAVAAAPASPPAPVPDAAAKQPAAVAAKQPTPATPTLAAARVQAEGSGSTEVATGSPPASAGAPPTAASSPTTASSARPPKKPKTAP